MTNFQMPPQKIQMIKDLREATGLGLGEAKAVVDYLYRGHGPVNRLINEIRDNPSQNYTWTNTANPELDVYGVGRKRVTGSEGGSGLSLDLEERVAKIERFIQNMYQDGDGA